jgi:hypothetical protein
LCASATSGSQRLATTTDDGGLAKPVSRIPKPVASRARGSLRSATVGTHPGPMPATRSGPSWIRQAGNREEVDPLHGMVRGMLAADAREADDKLVRQVAEA